LNQPPQHGPQYGGQYGMPPQYSPPAQPPGPPWPPGTTLAYGMRPQKPRRHRARTILLSILGAFLVIVVIGIIAAAASSKSTSTPPAASNSPAAAASSNPGGASQPTAQPAAQPTAQAPPQMTASQQSAIQAAEQYLQDEPGFSYQGLINQLDSPDGNGFSVADATFAVNNLSPAPNWDQQAADAAQNYMTTVGGFSACSMVQQLDSPDGSDFTQAQAEYGAQAVGLGTC
jgi:hypothetical protein